MALDLTEDEVHWISVAIENCKASAERISESDDEEEAAEGNYLVVKWADLQRKFPPPMIDIRDLPPEPGDG